MARYELIDGEKATLNERGQYKYTIVQMCKWLKVSKSGYYDWVKRPMSAMSERHQFLALLVTEAFEDSDKTYGYRRVHAQLARWGQACHPETVRKIMRELELVPCQPQPTRYSLTDASDAGKIPDLVNRDFTAEAPGTKMVGDITYIPTWEGWLYLATVIDCRTKGVIGWAMGDNYKTPLISQAISMAVKNHKIAPRAIFHSDRGSNYTSAEFAKVLNGFDIRQSVGRTGICYDNAMAESFFAVLKNERVHRTQYPTRAHARKDVARYIELRYNTTRLHSGLGYRTPQEVLDEHMNSRIAV